ncbi:MAG: hypothetical protein M1817_001387 [Caeruleum heppii]|nr:MAG: hypothetical protein M1817_001387 [Caeruleum heppii]
MSPSSASLSKPGIIDLRQVYDTPSIDFSKPPMPYVKGTRLQIRSHVPPPPTRNRRFATKADVHEIMTLPPLQRCLQRPSLGTELEGANLLPLLITGGVQLQDGGAQVVSVLVPDIAGQRTLIAKFYDPLYYKHGYPEDIDGDPFRCAEHDYSHEAAVYEDLGALQGKIVPQYYGSYTCNLTGSEWARSVYLIIIDFVSGVCMRDLDPRELSQPQRQTIMKTIIDAESEIYMHGVIHRDLHPRNFLLSIDNERGDVNRIVFVDFGNSDVRRILPGAYHKSRPSGVRVSPLLRWDERMRRHDQFLEQRWIEDRWVDFSWIDWDWQPWLVNCWGDSTHYAKITPEMDQTWLGRFRYPPSPPPY